MSRKACVAGVAVLAMALPVSANLLVNGDFETGNNTGWTPYGGSFGINGVGTDGVAGWQPVPFNEDGAGPGYIARVSFWSDAGHSGRGSAGMYQVVDVSAHVGQPMKLTGKFHYHNHSQEFMWHELGVMDGTDNDPNDGTPIALFKKTEADGASNPANDAWLDVSLDFVPTSNTVTVFYKGGTTAGGASFTAVDSLSLVPEPAALALLGLSLPMLRRRR